MRNIIFTDPKNSQYEVNSITPTFKAIIPFILIILSLAVNTYVHGQGIKFHRISIEHGLSQSDVNCILQDRRGFMWFGTQEGLNKYDGYRFTIFKSDPLDPNTLSNSYILSILEDKSGIFWVGTRGGGINRFDPRIEKCIQFEHDPHNKNSLSNNYVNTIYEDRRGMIWIGTEGGLNRFDREKGKFTCYKHDPVNFYSLSHDNVKSIYEDRSGMLWIGTEDGLNRFDREKEQFTRYIYTANNPNTLSHNNVNSIYGDRTDRLWIGTEGGLNRFNPEKGQFTHYKHNPHDSNSLSHDNVRIIYEDRSGKLWIGTFGGGLNKLDLNEKEDSPPIFVRYQTDVSDPFSLSNNRVQSIYEDRSGVLWIGTDIGLNKYDREKKQFVLYQTNPNNPNSLNNNFVKSIYEDQSGVFWIGTYGSGLNKFDRKKGRFTHYRHDPNDPHSLSNDLIRSITEDRSGNLWIGTEDGLNKFDRQSEQFICYKHNANNPKSLSNNFVYSIHEDREGVLWFGTEGGGLNKLVPNVNGGSSPTFIHYKHDPGNPHSLSNDIVYTIYESRSGVLWVGTVGGLNKFDREKEQFIRYLANPGDPSRLSNNFVLSIHEDQTGTLWIGTLGGGLNKFDQLKETFSHYKEKDELLNNTIYGILEDEHANLWLSHNKGISKFNPRTKKLKNYDVEDGLQSNEFNGGSYYKSQSGEMFFGGINGFNAFYPDKIKENPHIPPVVITDFQVFNKSVPIGKVEEGRSILEKTITDTKEIRLTHKDRVFSFEFAALHYASPKTKEYAYIMEGFEREWYYVGNRRYATYTNLSPGKYIFRVRGSNNDGIWNEEGTSIKITVIAPYWQTWWFRAFIILAGVSLVYGFYRYRLRLSRARTKILECKVKERTAELTLSNEQLQKEINERKGVEEEIRELKEFNENIVQNMAEGIVVQDVDLTFSFVNPAIANLLGYAPEELVGQNWKVIFPPDLYPIVEAADNLRASGEASHYEVELLCKNGKRVPMLIHGSPIFKGGRFAGTIAVFTDITKIKQAEEEIEKRQKYLESMLHNTPIAIMTYDASGCIIEWNPGAEKIFGYTCKEALGKNIDKLVSKPDMIDEAIGLTKKTLVGKKVLPRETVRYRKDGTPVNVIVGGSPIRIGDELHGFVAVYTDITERKKAEEKMRKTMEELERSKAELEKFVYVFSHDMKSPLRAIGQLASWISQDYAPAFDEAGKKQMNLLTGRVKRMDNLINGFLQYLRAGKIKKVEEIDLNTVAKKVIDSITPPVTTKVKIENKLPVVIANKVHFEQVFQSLISNAVKYMDKPEGKIKIGCIEEDSCWKISVVDNGPGIEEKYYEKIFQIFQILEPRDKHENIGVDLPVAKKIIELYGGRIWLESKVDEGSIFYFTLKKESPKF